MRIYCSSVADIVKDIAGKKFLIEVKPNKMPSKLSKSLTPVTDIDGEIVSYVVGKPPKSALMYSYPKEDFVEKMSFEKTQLRKERGKIEDSQRRNELFDRSKDRLYILPSKYAPDDVPLPPQYTDMIYTGQDIGVNYAHNTDLSGNSVKTLKFIHMLYDVVPNTWDKNIKIDDVLARSFANIAVNAMTEHGLAEPLVIRLLEKSVIRKANGESIPSSALFEFLTKNPNKKASIVKKYSNGDEYLDIVYRDYYPRLLKRFDEKTTDKVLEACTFNMENGKILNREACELACMMKRIPKIKDGKNVSPTTVSFDWIPEDSQFVSKIISGDIKSPKHEYFEVAKDLLNTENINRDFIIRNIDELVQYRKNINNFRSEIMTDTSNMVKKERILNSVESEYEKLKLKDGISSKDAILLNFVRHVYDKSNLNDTLRCINDAEKLIRNFPPDDSSRILTEAIPLCSATGKGGKNVISKHLLNLLFEVIKDKKSFNNDIKNFITHVKENYNKEDVDVLLGVLEFRRAQTDMIMKNADEIVKYVKDKNNLFSKLVSKYNFPYNMVLSMDIKYQKLFYESLDKGVIQTNQEVLKACELLKQKAPLEEIAKVFNLPIK